MRRLRILIADDHELIRRGIRGVIRSRREWKLVGEAVSGLDAVDKAATLKPDLIILDIGMPDLDGLAVTRQLRKERSNTRAIILTMHDSPVMLRRAMEAGARGYILKSDLTKELIEAIESVSEGKLFLTPKVSDIVPDALTHADDGTRAKRPSCSEPSRRELEIIELLAKGKANKEIATKLGITVRTVETHRARIMLKLGVRSVGQLVYYAINHGFVPVAAKS